MFEAQGHGLRTYIFHVWNYKLYIH